MTRVRRAQERHDHPPPPGPVQNIPLTGYSAADDTYTFPAFTPASGSPYYWTATNDPIKVTRERRGVMEIMTISDPMSNTALEPVIGIGWANGDWWGIGSGEFPLGDTPYWQPYNRMVTGWHHAGMPDDHRILHYMSVNFADHPTSGIPIEVLLYYDYDFNGVPGLPSNEYGLIFRFSADPTEVA